MESLGCQAKELGLDLEGNEKSDMLELTCLPPPHTLFLALLNGKPLLPLSPTS